MLVTIIFKDGTIRNIKTTKIETMRNIIQVTTHANITSFKKSEIQSIALSLQGGT